MDESLEDFFEADHRRRGEGIRFGNRWQAEDAPGIYQDLCWAPGTGELYTISYVDRLGPGLWTVPHFGRQPRMVTVLATIDHLHDTQAKLSGWHEQEKEYGSLEWVRQRVGHPRPPEFFAAELGDGQHRVCRGWYERLLHLEQPGVDVAAGPGGVALCRPEGSRERTEAFLSWPAVAKITTGPWRWPHHHHLFPPPAAGHCYLGIEAGDEHHIMLVPGSGPDMLMRRVERTCGHWFPGEGSNA